MKANKKLLYSLIVVVLVMITGGIVYAASISDKGKEIGQEVAEINKNGSEDMIATVNGTGISQKSFNSYKIMLNQNHQYSDKEILDKMIERIVLFNKALSGGFEASDEEVVDTVAEVKSVFVQDEEQYKFLKDYLDGMGVSEDQYWGEIVPEEYKQVLSVNKLYDSLRNEFIKNYNLTDSKEIKSKFDVYWDEYKNDMVNKAVVQTDIK